METRNFFEAIFWDDVFKLLVISIYLEGKILQGDHILKPHSILYDVYYSKVINIYNRIAVIPFKKCQRDETRRDETP